MTGSVRVRVNGESLEVAAGTRLLAFLESRGVDTRRVAVERGREVVPRARHAEIEMKDGDEFEVVAFVGGG